MSANVLHASPQVRVQLTHYGLLTSGWHQRALSTPVHVMAYCLFSSKPVPELKMNYCQLNPIEPNSVTLKYQNTKLSSLICKCLAQTKIMKILLSVVLKLIDKSGHDFTFSITATLWWCIKNCAMIGSLYLHYDMFFKWFELRPHQPFVKPSLVIFHSSQVQGQDLFFVQRAVY